MHLHDFWFLLIAVLWIGYFFLEGFDFGIGVLTKTLAKDRTERRVLINTIGPVWDGNEVWLITAAGATFAAFPDWYATLFSGFYLPLLAVLVCLIVRGVAFEYRHKRNEERWQRNWENAIFWCSLLPAFLWGVAFANIVRGVPIGPDKNFTGGVLDLLSPYALLGGLFTLVLFTFHGAVFAALKTVGDIRDRARATRPATAWPPRRSPRASWPGRRPSPATGAACPRRSSRWWRCSRPWPSTGRAGRGGRSPCPG